MNRANDSVVVSPEYRRFIDALKGRILSARLSAARAVNRDLVLLYWDIGRDIVEKRETLGWGESVVEMMANDLRTAFPGMRGFSSQNLWRMQQFYRVHTSEKFLSLIVREIDEKRSRVLNAVKLSQAVRELAAAIPWGHHANAMAKVTDPAARLYYLRATAQFGWTRNVLLNQIKADAYARSLKEGKSHNFALALPEHLAEHAGKMDFYLNLLNDKERAVGDNPSIGIILCAEKDDVEVEYALKTKRNPIGVELTS